MHNDNIYHLKSVKYYYYCKENCISKLAKLNTNVDYYN